MHALSLIFFTDVAEANLNLCFVLTHWLRRGWDGIVAEVLLPRLLRILHDLTGPVIVGTIGSA